IAVAEDQSPDLFEAQAGVKLMSRSFYYTGTLDNYFDAGVTGVPADYTLPASPVISLDLESYPGVLLSEEWLHYVGTILRADLGFGTTSQFQTAEGDTLKARNEYFGIMAGLKGRIPLPWLELEPSFAWGIDSASLNSIDTAIAAPVPKVSYSYLRPGLRARLRVEKVYVELDAAYRIGLSAGGIEKAQVGVTDPPPHFPNTKFLGFDASAVVGFALSSRVDLKAGLDIVQYGLNFNPVELAPQDEIAGGATDRYISSWIGVSFHLPYAAAPTPSSVQPANAQSIDGKSDTPQPSEDEIDEEFDDFDF
ncbi:MAG: hypothetical protein MK135_15255, partial [Polyangiaceae bacterium]|nr:hypothetical protein [Polyangiaceae bacterium]